MEGVKCTSSLFFEVTKTTGSFHSLLAVFYVALDYSDGVN